MKTFAYYEQDGRTITKTEQEILDGWFAAWADEMRKRGKADEISHENCLDDYIVIHWAWEVT